MTEPTTPDPHIPSPAPSPFSPRQRRPYERLRIIERPKGGGKTAALIEIMLAPGNEDVVYIAPTAAQAAEAYRRACWLQMERGQRALINSNRFISASRFDFQHQAMHHTSAPMRVVIDEVGGALSGLLPGLSVVAVAGTDATPVWPPTPAPTPRHGSLDEERLREQTAPDYALATAGLLLEEREQEAAQGGHPTFLGEENAYVLGFRDGFRHHALVRAVPVSDPQIRVKRNGLVELRADGSPIGSTHRHGPLSVWVCPNCYTERLSDTRARAANELFDHWTREHKPIDPSPEHESETTA